jgi:glycosyltransferase involved in cell wall biosynthesis
MKLKVALIAPFPPPSAGMTVLASTLKDSLENHDVSVAKINTIGPVPTLLKKIGIGKIYQHLSFYMNCKNIIKNDIAIMISSSGGSFYLKIIPVLFLSMILGKKVILDFVGGGMLNKLHRINVLLLKMFDNILVPTSIFETAFKERGINCSVFPHIIDIDRFSARKDSYEKITFLSAKGLFDYSSVDDLIKAFAIIKKDYPTAEFLIAGEGPEKENLQILITKLGLKDIKFIGNVSYEEMPSLFQAATIFLHGTKIESFGIALVEAMSSGTPIISTNVGGIPDIIDDNTNGFLVDHGDYSTMAEKIILLLNDKELYQRISKNGISQSRKYHPSVLTKLLISKINIILERERLTD